MDTYANVSQSDIETLQTALHIIERLDPHDAFPPDRKAINKASETLHYIIVQVRRAQTRAHAEDQADIISARQALAEAKREGTTSLQDLKDELS